MTTWPLNVTVTYTMTCPTSRRAGKDPDPQAVLLTRKLGSKYSLFRKAKYAYDCHDGGPESPFHHSLSIFYLWLWLLLLLSLFCYFLQHTSPQLNLAHLSPSSLPHRHRPKMASDTGWGIQLYWPSIFFLNIREHDLGAGVGDSRSTKKVKKNKSNTLTKSKHKTPHSPPPYPSSPLLPIHLYPAKLEMELFVCGAV